MWQLYICDENGKEKPFLKPWDTVEKAEKFADMMNLKPYTIKKVK